MFRNVYGYEKERWNAAPGVPEFIKKNGIVAIHELVYEEEKNKFFRALLGHSHNPTVYFFLPDGTQPIPPGIDKVEPADQKFLNMLEQFMEKYEEWKKKQ
ncbi:MAG: hypothetical protein E3J72_21730 [Planctomycetota bacterium]|nr:MAG: hypothetical protein E3J72_21730 [Planctomycetota bacterium]